MKRIVAILLLGFGALLLTAGIWNADTMGAELHRLLKDPPPDKAMWLLILGTLSTGLGVAGLFTPTHPMTRDSLTPPLKPRRLS